MHLTGTRPCPAETHISAPWRPHLATHSQQAQLSQGSGVVVWGWGIGSRALGEDAWGGGPPFSPHSPACLLARQSFIHSFTLTPAHSFTHTLIHTLAHPLTCSLTHSLTYSLTHTLAHSFTHTFIHSLTHSLTHTLTHTLPGLLTHFAHPWLPHTHTCIPPGSLTYSHTLTTLW